MTKGVKKICGFCKKEYIPKSNNSKFCSRKCNNKASGKRRTKRYQTDREYRKYILEQKSSRFKKRYYDELGFKEKHYQKLKKYRKTEGGHKKRNVRESKRQNERYNADPEYRNYISEHGKKRYMLHKKEIDKKIEGIIVII